MTTGDSGGDQRIQGLPAVWTRIRVVGPSMSPTLRDGDHVLARAVSDAGRVRPGDIAIVRFPTRPELLSVKRVLRAVEGGHWVEGDNAFLTDDSRAFGPAVVVGRVVARLWPRPGRIPPPLDL